MDDLTDRHILIVEDTYLVASDLAWCLEQAGAIIVGPLPTGAEALCMLDRGTPVDAAILDIMLADGSVFPFAEQLHRRQIPFVFHTAHMDLKLPENLADIARFSKPTDWRTLSRALFRPRAETAAH